MARPKPQFLDRMTERIDPNDAAVQDDQSSNPWPRPAVSIMVFRDDRVLLGQRAKPPLRGVWSLPGGRIEPGETVEEAAHRELAEETGIHASITGHAGTRDIIRRDATGTLVAHYVLTVLVGQWLSGDPHPASDCLAAEWVTLDALATYDLTDGTEDLIRRTWATLDPSRKAE